MNFLNSLLPLSEAGNDLSHLPEDAMKDIQKNIREGAKDLDQLWANALELVHKAYEVAAVQRPSPDMRDGWKQYEENLQYAVQQLAKHRGMDGDWRMSSSVFREAMEPRKPKFRVEVVGDKFGESHSVAAKSIDEVIASIKASNTDLYDLDVKQNDPKTASVSFSKWGIKKNYRINISQV